MATMIKEKRRDKKVSREKNKYRNKSEVPSEASENFIVEEEPRVLTDEVVRKSSNSPECSLESGKERTPEVPEEFPLAEPNISDAQNKTSPQDINVIETQGLHLNKYEMKVKSTKDDCGSKSDLKSQDNPMVDLSSLDTKFNHLKLQADSCKNVHVTAIHEPEERRYEFFYPTVDTSIENIAPTAPAFEDELEYTDPASENVVTKIQKLESMSLEEAIRLFGGKEIEEVQVLSEKVEEIVEAGPTSGPDHPLVDLLSTFRCSLMAVERECSNIAQLYSEEERERNRLWRVEPREVKLSKSCKCGQKVEMLARWEHAEIRQGAMAAERVRLTGLRHAIRDEYALQLHAALTAHAQIEDLVYAIIHSNEVQINEALSLVLQALRSAGIAGGALPAALQRWARALVEALLRSRDVRHVLTVLHHLNRQSRSVRWASKLLDLNVSDASEAARLVALLGVLLSRGRLETAAECSEELEGEGWEEVSTRGEGGGVSEGALRERDLRALLRAAPLRLLAARLLLIPHADYKRAASRGFTWGDSAGGRGVLKAACGVRALLYVLTCARTHHPRYSRLHADLADIACHTLHALAALHNQSRSSYETSLAGVNDAELQTCFTSSVGLMELHRVPTPLLTDAAAEQYAQTIIANLHATSSVRVECLSLDLPVVSCEERVRCVIRTAADRVQHESLARSVLQFLMQVGTKRGGLSPVADCGGKCVVEARRGVGEVLAAHPTLHSTALHMLADISQAEGVSEEAVLALAVGSWRPTVTEACRVLDDWKGRCQHLLPPLLLNIDTTPHSGISLESQQAIGWWLCEHAARQPPAEWAWQALLRLRVHRTQWALPLEAPPPPRPPDNPFAAAFALFASSWGHCVPLICSSGVEACHGLAKDRPAVAIRGAELLVRALAINDAWDSLAATPRFGEAFRLILESGPTLLQRALPRPPPTGAALLTRTLLAIVDSGSVSGSEVRAWCVALWRGSLGAGALSSLDVFGAALLSSHAANAAFDAHAASVVQEGNGYEEVRTAVRHCDTAPLLCERILRAWHAVRESRGEMQALLSVLYSQHVSKLKIHVDNALKQIGSSVSSDQLSIHLTSTAVLTAPFVHPAHLVLWRLFMCLYLTRAPSYTDGTGPPSGCWLLSGIVKSRVLSQLKRRLRDTAAYHQQEASTIPFPQRPPPPAQRSTPTTPSDDKLLPSLSIADLTGESDCESESSSDADETAEEAICSKAVNISEVNILLKNYHNGAEKMVLQFLQWLEEGEESRAQPYHADLARFISPQAFEAAWRRYVAASRPIATPDDEAPPPRAVSAPRTLIELAIQHINCIPARSLRRRRLVQLHSTSEDGPLASYSRPLLQRVDKHLEQMASFAREWGSEASHVEDLDSRLLQLLPNLRVKRPLPDVRARCSNKCEPLVMKLSHYEWCIDNATVQDVNDNRTRAWSCVRRLSRPRPSVARSAATLTSLSREVHTREQAAQVLECAWSTAAHVARCSPASAALSSLVDHLAERWICEDANLCSRLLSSLVKAGISDKDEAGKLQLNLCGALVAPRRLSPGALPILYSTLLTLPLPNHYLFSYLSRFEMSSWVQHCETERRQAVLSALLQAAMQNHDHMFLELLGVHLCALLDEHHCGQYVCECARTAARGQLPETHSAHVARAMEACLPRLSSAEASRMLRALGTIWAEARSSKQVSKFQERYTAHAPHVAYIVSALQRHYLLQTPETFQPAEDWAYHLTFPWEPWIEPRAREGGQEHLAPGKDDQPFSTVLPLFVDNMRLLIQDCDCSDRILSTLLSWVLTISRRCERSELRVLLHELRRLPWREHLWFTAAHIHTVTLGYSLNRESDADVTSFLADVIAGVTSDRWLLGAPADHVPRLLLALLSIVYYLPLAPEPLNSLAALDWSQTCLGALQHQLESFYRDFHSVQRAYHLTPQFRFVLLASGLSPSPTISSDPWSRAKRSLFISLWVRAASDPILATHAAEHAKRMLTTLQELGRVSLQATAYKERCACGCQDNVLQGVSESSEDELTQLTASAALLLCVPPAADTALPVWCEYIRQCDVRMLRACMRAASSLTEPAAYAVLADAAAKVVMTRDECAGWADCRLGLAGSVCADSAALVSRGKLHAAYATLGDVTQTMQALAAAHIDFVENEVICAVWIVVAARHAIASESVLRRWSEDAPRSLLRAVTLRTDPHVPTGRLRTLAQTALCACPASYEEACRRVVPNTSDVMNPNEIPRTVLALARSLYSQYPRYFVDSCLEQEETV